MPTNEQAPSRTRTTANRRPSRAQVGNIERAVQQTHPATILQRARQAPDALTPREALRMQRPCGNRAVTQMLAARSCRRSGMRIQAKLTVGALGDAYEQEADRAADQAVSRINAPAPTRGAGVQAARRRAESADHQTTRAPGVQRLPGGGGMAAPPHIERQIQQLRGGGHALPDGVRGSMEQAFGADLRGVRVHADAGADALSGALQAKAFATGQDIFFREGAYSPGTSAGQRLIAHELAHTMQQGAATRIARWGGIKSGVTLHEDVTEDALGRLQGPEKQFYELPGIKEQVGRFSEDMDAREAAKIHIPSWKATRELIECVAEWKPLRSWKLGKKLKKVRSPKGWGKFKPFAGLRPLGQTGYVYKRSILGKKSHLGKWLLTKKQRAKARERWRNLEAYASAKDVREQENHAEGGMYEWPRGRPGAISVHKTRIENWYRFAELYARKRDWAHAFMFLGLALHTAEDQGAHGHGMPGLGHDPRRQIPIPEKWNWPETRRYREDYRKGWQFHWCDTRDQNPRGYDMSVRVAVDMLKRFAQFNATQPPTEKEMRQWVEAGMEPILEWKYFYYPERMGSAMAMIYKYPKKNRALAKVKKLLSRITGSGKDRLPMTRAGKRRQAAQEKVEKLRQEREEQEASERDLELLLNMT